MKTVGECSLLTVISIKDIRFAVENHPQNLPFSVIVFFVYVIYYENCWEMFTFNGYKHQGHSICSRKPPSKFVIGAFFRLVMLFAVFGHFFFVYLNYFENCWEMFTFNGYKHQGHSICSRKPPSKFVIGAFFRLKSINNSKNTYLFENSTIHRYQIHKHFVKLQSINNDMFLN
ncbi:hypothetical protein AGLY_017367 [Aphis glycines]|uniref:Uncharacterized protein n=1 Tax=Aphis glycines TaxID=307491 RepID=A0A6G0SVW6_APHGL|nr:hypothetical protein AGLY_017367 [Aphis glycines]